MAAKTAGNFQVYEPIGIGDLTAHGTTQLYDLGLRVKGKDMGTTEYGYGEFIYLTGVASTVRGSVVLIKDDYTTSLVAARDKGSLAVALSACVASEYGWYQIKGQGVAACDTVAANAPCDIDGTSGQIDDAAVAGDQVIGMRTVTSDDTSTCVVNMSCNPATADFDNA
jgi:hypothetical protein